MNSIKIAKENQLEKINTILAKYDIPDNSIENYGAYKAKIDITKLSQKPTKGKVILVTSINPTIYGEGKTTVAIGLCDALNKLNHKAIVVLREPSMGPVFGIKGGATGGGYSQVVPMEDINLHFTGDFHALTSANNLLCAIVDNHIFQGNVLNIKKVTINRCLDINDRALRNIVINSTYNRDDHFDITVATELMAILCLAKNFKDLKNRVARMIIGYNDIEQPIYVSDLNATDAICILLKDAINPNAVQTLEKNLALVHGGPFANIAHGCSSIISLNTALNYADFVVTEAGFGSDLGAEKYWDIVAQDDLTPSLVVINVTIRGLKHQGLCPPEEINISNPQYVSKGLPNLEAHIANMQNFTNNILVVLNKFDSDSLEEIDVVKDYLNNQNISFTISDTFIKGSDGGLDFAKKVVALAQKSLSPKLYNLNDSIENKILSVAKNVYHTSKLNYSFEAQEKIKAITKLGLDKMPICVAKTQYSLTDNKNLLGFPKNVELKITDVKLCNGAGFIVVYMGNILTMPGLGLKSSYLNMQINENKEIEGLF